VTSTMLSVIFIACFIAAANAACDNGCSGHGTCNINDVCKCHDGWATGMTKISGDCSDRVCPYDFAFASKPTNSSKRHEYAECSARGVCDRTTGECECMEGYEGQACHRTSCPNDCSGHGRCQYTDNIPKYGTLFDYEKKGYGTDYWTSLYLTNKNYYGWDNLKTRGCVCDPGYIDIDCSKRLCPFGDDPMTVRKNVGLPDYDQTQTIEIATRNDEYNDAKTFSFIYMNKHNETFNTMPIDFPSSASDCHDFTIQIQNALYGIPTNAILKVKVGAECLVAANPGFVTRINVTFTGDNNEGPQHQLIANTRMCKKPGCSPLQDGLDVLPEPVDYDSSSFKRPFNQTELVASDKESEECSNRGKCDYETGICNCFQGYSGLACNKITQLH